MRRKHIDQVMKESLTYRNATPACKARFAEHLQLGQSLTKVQPLDKEVRDGWIWFWLGWFRR